MAINTIGIGPLATSSGGTTGKLDKAHSDLMKASQQFESYFIDQMLKEMRKSIPKDEELGDSDDQQAIFQDMSDQSLADSASKQGSMGIANMLYNELSKGLPPNNPAAMSTSTNAAAQIYGAKTPAVEAGSVAAGGAGVAPQSQGSGLLAPNPGGTGPKRRWR